MPVPPNHLIRHAISYGIDAITLRATLRGMHDDLIADGPGASLGVHGLGVFYVYRNVQRYVVRDGRVFDVAQRDVLKLRPQKSVPDELTESDDVRITVVFQASPSRTWTWQSTSRAGRFSVTSPATWSGTNHDFVRQVYRGNPSYVMVRNDISDATISTCESAIWSPTDNELFAVRFDNDMRSVHCGQGVNQNHPADLPTVLADTDSVGPLTDLLDPSGGREVKAWICQRAIAISDR